MNLGLTMNGLGKLDAGNPHVQFDEGSESDGHWLCLSTRRLRPTLLGLDWFAGMGEDNAAGNRAALKSREAHEQFVEADAAKMLAATPETLVQALRSLLCPVDAAVLTTDFANFALRSIREGIGESRDGMIDDDIAHLTPWGFELSQIRIPVLLMHGEQDQFVPVSHTNWLASRIPNVEARLLSDDGHLTLSLRRIPEVHAWLLSRWPLSDTLWKS